MEKYEWLKKIKIKMFIHRKNVVDVNKTVDENGIKDSSKISIIERLKNEKIEKDKIIEEKDKILSKIYSENEFVKLKALHQNEKSESQKKDEMDIKEKYDKKNSLKVSAMKKSVNNTVKKVKKNFNMDDDDNVNFVKNIQNKIK